MQTRACADDHFSPRVLEQEVNSPRAEQSRQQHVGLPLFTPESWRESHCQQQLLTPTKMRYIFTMTHFCTGERRRSRRACPAGPRGPQHKS